MKVILLRDINSVGNAGEIVSVANGYARNFLIPKRQALLATDASADAFDRAAELGWRVQAIRVGPEMPGWWDDARDQGQRR